MLESVLQFEVCVILKKQYFAIPTPAFYCFYLLVTL